MALPDGAHLSEEDYSYFVRFHPSLSPTSVLSANRALQHCTFSPSTHNSQQHNAETNIPTNQTLFGISYVISSFSLLLPLSLLPPSLSSSFDNLQSNLISSIQLSDTCPFFSFFFHFRLSRCNRQLASSELHRRPSDVTRSMVQKAVIVIASHPIFVRSSPPFHLSFCPPKRLTAPAGPDKRQTRRRHPRLLRPTRFRRNQALGRLLYLS